MALIEEWVGAESMEDAVRIVLNRYPGCEILQIWQRVAGLWAYKIEVEDEKIKSCCQCKDAESDAKGEVADEDLGND